jgi:hypothetical protein
MLKNQSKKNEQAPPIQQPLLKRLVGNPEFIVRFLICLQVGFMLWQFYPQMSTNGDDAFYYILGQAIAEGKGYHLISDPDLPPQTKYPPVYPVFLAFMKAFSDTPLFAKVVTGFLAIFATFLSYRLFLPILGSNALPLIFLMAFSFQFAQFSVILMSEVPYVLLTVLALFLLMKSTESPKNRLLFWLTIAISILPMQCRSVGIAFSLAWICVTLIRRQYRYAIWHVAFAAILIILVKFLAGGSNPYFTELLQKNSYNPELGFISAWDMCVRIAQNLQKYTIEVIPATIIAGIKLPIKLIHTLGILLTAIIATGWIRMLLSKYWHISIYTALYAGILLIWQVQWSSERFLVSILPFVLGLMLLGLKSLAEGLAWSASQLLELGPVSKSPWTRRIINWVAIWGVVIILAGFNMYAAWNSTRFNTGNSSDWVNYNSCADWVRSQTPKNSLIVARKPEVFFLRSKRQSILYPFSHDVDKIISVFKEKKVSYVIFDNFFWTKTSAEYLYPVVASHPDLFEVVYALRNPDTFVLRFKSE